MSEALAPTEPSVFVNAFTEHEILEVVREWKHFWMNQTQNGEADYKNYFNRAFGIDANMSHHLAKMLYKKQIARKSADTVMITRETLKSILDNQNFSTETRDSDIDEIIFDLFGEQTPKAKEPR